MGIRERERALWALEIEICKGRGLRHVGSGEHPGDESEDGIETGIEKPLER